MRACHNLVGTAAAVNNCTSVPIITMQSLVPIYTMLFRANYPYNHVTGAIRGSHKRRAATAITPCNAPIGDDGGRVGGRDAESRKRVAIGSESDVRALISPIGCRCLDDAAVTNRR